MTPDRLGDAILAALHDRPPDTARTVAFTAHDPGPPTVTVVDTHPTGDTTTAAYAYDPALAHAAGPDQALAMIVHLLHARTTL